ncbi:MAG TPA: hypothetical protein VIG05_03560 [Candidatus Nitrosotenuis sp.]|jgi:hypothetical protein
MKIALILALAGLVVYFGIVLFVIPQEYSSITTLEPKPSFTAKISSDHIILGDSFDVVINSSNSNDVADIQIVSIAFPSVMRIGDQVKVVGYDFTQSPRYVKTGDKIGYDYSGGTKSVSAQYPSIEAYSRPVNPGTNHSIELRVTPDAVGNFTIFAKTVAIPHTDNYSHYPYSGIKDHQNEYVESFSVTVSK